jgi:hypothetical protein
VNVRWGLIAVALAGCEPGECPGEVVRVVKLDFTIAASDVLALRDAKASSCFASARGITSFCVSGGIGIGRSGVLRPRLPLDELSIVEVYPRGELTEQRLSWSWKGPEQLQDGDRYTLEVTDRSGTVLYEGETEVRYDLAPDGCEPTTSAQGRLP